jgi:hypothetical protein
MRAFIGAALISLFVAAVWFLWIHLKSPCQQSSRPKNLNTADATSQFPKGISILPKLFLVKALAILVHSRRRNYLALEALQKKILSCSVVGYTSSGQCLRLT